jgi:hypothetical protein
MREHDSKLTVAPSAQSSRIAGILFADVVGFSSLSDMEVVRFHYEFLGAVGRLLALTKISTARSQHLGRRIVSDLPDCS